MYIYTCIYIYNIKYHIYEIDIIIHDMKHFLIH